jgi:hypothetical protein
MYEWETEVNNQTIESNKHKLREEIKRILNVTLRGDFKKEEDRKYWEVRARQLSSRLSALEEMSRPRPPKRRTAVASLA